MNKNTEEAGLLYNIGPSKTRKRWERLTWREKEMSDFGERLLKWKRDFSHWGRDSGSVPGMPLHCHLWAAFAHVCRPAYPMILCYYLNPAPSMRPPALSSLSFFFLLLLTYFLLHLSLHSIPSFLSPLSQSPSSPSFQSSFRCLSLFSFPLPNTARGWAPATSMRTDDSVLLFSPPRCDRPPPGEVCLPWRRGGNEKDWLI